MSPLSVDIRPSWTLAGLMILLHGLAAFAVLLVPAQLGSLDWLWRVAALFFVIASLAWVLHRQVLLRSGQSIIRIATSADDQWTLTQRNGATFSGKLAGSSTLTAWLLIPVVQQGVGLGRQRSLCLLPDSLSQEDARQLRVRMTLAK